MGSNFIIVSEQIFSSTWWNKFIFPRNVVSGRRTEIKKVKNDNKKFLGASDFLLGLDLDIPNSIELLT